VTLGYPRVVGKTEPLSFHLASTAELRPGTWEIPEPGPDAPILALDHFDVIVVPTLVFDELGNRIGWGAGHYDRTLRAAPQALRVGFAYAFQRSPHPIPTTPSDEPLDVVVTEEGVLRTKAERQRRPG
jgi:5-formyltetrahydrofolate cyclo-ligase